ncbi:O-antigen ligase family protein [Mastigocoleus testarum]|uniref:O-antigen ligase-related domain-containing protein n=1 Tax=Mastigocoleus testarum BC008 TaxID=371196 RepID=A0A0V7ZGR8_9CYAN|nr:O-antigen ligase family protein [Mastigocoleus testarum]KST63678.1 hypothetical protein BC008_14570 [Mastigocoleus testarum BC008]KST63780.1 hypothetical protein BC008_15105 [Mastigocoleus testarum BC008]
MKQQRRFLARSSTVATEESLIHRGLIRWGALTEAEQLFCSFIILTPVWWLMGWGYQLLLWSIIVAINQILRNGTLGLKRPSLTVISIIGFGIYRAISTSINSSQIKPSFILGPLASLCCLGLIIWYLQSKNIRIRLEVITWAFSVLVIEMLVFWIVAQLILQTPHYTPNLSLFGYLTNKRERFIPGAGNGNYLLPYFPDDKVAAGFSRFSFFFPGPESLAILVGFIGLVALEVKNRSWSIALFFASAFLLLTSATRSNWIVFPLILVIRYVTTIGKGMQTWLIFSLIAVVSFVSFSLPPATDFITNTFTNTVESTGNARADSTEVRALIYQRTWETIITEPEDFIFGRGLQGPTVLPGYAPAQIGSHSFILGTLFYRSGFMGSTIFVSFWVSLILYLYRTRKDRPICSFLMILYISMTFSVMELESTVPLILIICVALTTTAKPIRGRI